MREVFYISLNSPPVEIELEEVRPFWKRDNGGKQRYGWKITSKGRKHVLFATENLNKNLLYAARKGIRKLLIDYNDYFKGYRNYYLKPFYKLNASQKEAKGKKI
jgi:hypothetical protein